MITSEIEIRLGIFALALVALAAFETLAPRRARCLPRRGRWPANLVLAALGSVAARIVVPIGLTGFASGWSGAGNGLFPALGWHGPWAGVAAFGLMDLAIFTQHVAMHRVPALWRLHRVHHSDPDFDATTAIRFHPIEIALSALWKLVVIMALGVAPQAILVFEIALNALALFGHANATLPLALDRVLRTVLVTPDFHRVHHSVHHDEQNMNFGFCMTWWDHLFGLHRAQPREGHARMRIGLSSFRLASEQRLASLLLQPARSEGAVPPDFS